MTISQSVTYQATISGGVNVPLDVLLAWLKLEGTYSYTVTEGAQRDVPAGYEGYWNYTDYHFHSSATYDQWYCTDEDVKGQVTKWYEGRYTARGYKFDHRTYWAYIYAI